MNCTGVCVPTALGPEWTPLISVLATVLLGLWTYLLKLPSFQRALGAENKDKREKLNAIVHAVVEATESTPLVPPKKPGE
jgi:hypothetical protein